MPAATSKGYPYPLGTDRVMDGDDSIKALAEAVDLHLGRAASGTWLVAAVPAGGATGTVAVTFPAGRFNVAPVVNITILVGNVSASQAYASAFPTGPVTTSGFSVGARHATGTSDMSGTWSAHQV